MTTIDYSILEWIGFSFLIVLFVIYTVFSFLVIKILFEPSIKNKCIRWIISLIAAIIVSFMIVLCMKYCVVGIFHFIFG